MKIRHTTIFRSRLSGAREFAEISLKWRTT